MRTLPKGEFYCGYCFVILTSFLVKAEDNLFLMRQRWSTYTDALNNLVIYPFKYLSDKSPEDRIRNKEKMQLTMTPLDPSWVLRWSLRSRQSIAWGTLFY